jgi:xanthine dehydrogenase accessory factor
MIICIDGTTFGSIGGGCGESIVRSAALRCLVTTKSCELLEVELTDEMGEKEGDVCGGSMSVFLEPFGV